MPNPKTQKVLLAVKVVVEVVAPNKLRKFIFGLEKTKQDDKDIWAIDFQILDRAKKSDQFSEALTVDVDVTLKNVPMAEAVVERGLTLRQTRYINNVVSGAKEAFEAGAITEKQFKSIVEKTLEKR